MKFNRYSIAILLLITPFGWLNSEVTPQISEEEQARIDREEIVKHPSWINRSRLNDHEWLATVTD